MSAHRFSRRSIAAGILATTTCVASGALAQKNYGPGATDTEIKIGNIMPYSGPASAYAVIGQTEAAYFKMLNDKGGINGRKINFISYDDGYSPPKAVEQARKLVESDEVLFIFNPLGTPSNSATMKYMNAKKVPQLFVATGATKFSDDPKANPWTMGWQPSYQSEGQIYGKYILANFPNAKIGVLYQNDDFGKDVYKGLKDGLGDKAKSMIISEATYEVTEPTIDSQILKLKASGADLFMDITTPKFAAQAIKKVAETGWKPTHILNNVSISTGSVLKPAGLENSKDILSSGYLKDATDPKTKTDPSLKDFFAFLDKYLPDIDRANGNLIYGYGVSQTMEQVLKQCGDNLTRENVMKQAASLKDFVSPVFIPGVKANTGPNDYFVHDQLQMMKFNGESWEFFGPVISAEAKS